MRALVLLVLLAGAPGAVAQAAFGARLGALYTGTTARDARDDLHLGTVLGGGVSAFVEVPLAPALSAVADVGYTQGGFADSIPLTEGGTGDDYSTRVRAHYLTLAPAVTVHPRAGRVVPYAFAGPRLDLKLAERSRLDGASGASDTFGDVAYGASAGAGLRLARAASLGDVRADLRYAYLFAGGYLRQQAVELRVGLAF